MGRWSALAVGLILVLSSGCRLSRSAGASRHPPDNDNVTFAVSPDGKTLLFSSPSADLFTLDFATMKPRRLTNTLECEGSPRFSPDGNRFVYTACDAKHLNSHLFLRSPNGANRRPLTTGSFADTGATFSQDGKRLTFVRCHLLRNYAFGGQMWNEADVYTINADGSALRRITRGNHYGVSSPRFLYGTSRILYYPVDYQKDGVIRTVDEKSGISSDWLSFKISSPDIIVADIDLTVDGKHIAAIADYTQPFRYDLVYAEAATQKLIPLWVTSVSSYNRGVAFSSDGQALYFLAGRDSGHQGWDLYRVDVKSRQTVKLVDWAVFRDADKIPVTPSKTSP
jgi:Tol biopolymer transport system component